MVMSKRERLERTIAGDSTDRVPVALWRHWPRGDQRAPDRLMTCLNTIPESTVRFVDALRKSGISGIFYAVQHASYNIMASEEYGTFGRPYDRRILEVLNKDWWLNMLHLHGDTPIVDM